MINIVLLEPQIPQNTLPDRSVKFWFSVRWYFSARRSISRCTASNVSFEMIGVCAPSAWYIGSSPVFRWYFFVMWLSENVVCKSRLPV